MFSFFPILFFWSPRDIYVDLQNEHVFSSRRVRGCKREHSPRDPQEVSLEGRHREVLHANFTHSLTQTKTLKILIYRGV